MVVKKSSDQFEPTRDQAVVSTTENQRFVEYFDDKKDKLTFENLSLDLKTSNELGELETDVEGGVLDDSLDILQTEANYLSDLVSRSFGAMSYEGMIQDPRLMQQVDYAVASSLLMPAFASAFEGLDYESAIDETVFDAKIDALVDGYVFPASPDAAPTDGGKQLIQLTVNNPEAGKYKERYLPNLLNSCAAVLKQGVRSHNEYFVTDGSEELNDENGTSQPALGSMRDIAGTMIDEYSQATDEGKSTWEAIKHTMSTTKENFESDERNWQKLALGVGVSLATTYAGNLLGKMFGGWFGNDQETKDSFATGGALAGGILSYFATNKAWELLNPEQLSTKASFTEVRNNIVSSGTGKYARSMLKGFRTMQYKKEGDKEYIIGYGGIKTQIDIKNKKLVSKSYTKSFESEEALFNAAMYTNATIHDLRGTCANDTPFSSFDNSLDATTSALLVGGATAGGVGYATKLNPRATAISGLLAGGAGAYMAGGDGAIIGGIKVATAELGTQKALRGGFMNMNGASALFPDLRSDLNRSMFAQHLNEIGGRKAGNVNELSTRDSAKSLQLELEQSIDTSTGKLSPLGVQRGMIDVKQTSPESLSVYSWGRPQMQTSIELVGARSGTITHLKLPGCDFMITVDDPNNSASYQEAEKQAVRLSNFVNYVKYTYEASCSSDTPFSFKAPTGALGYTRGAGIMVDAKADIYGNALLSTKQVRALSYEELQEHFPQMLDQNGQGVKEFVNYLNSLAHPQGGSWRKSDIA